MKAYVFFIKVLYHPLRIKKSGVEENWFSGGEGKSDFPKLFHLEGGIPINYQSYWISNRKFQEILNLSLIFSASFDVNSPLFIPSVIIVLIVCFLL